MSSIDEIKARINIVDLVSETVQLRRTGKNYTGFCPFHSNTRTPAFVVFSDTGTWRCFGQCNEGGDIFRFVMKKEGWDFNEALKYLADRAGIQLRPPTPQEQEAAEEHERLRQLLEEAVVFYRHQMTSSPAGQQAQAYLVKRGISLETIENWGLGYAPNSWEALKSHLNSKGYTDKELFEAGLTAERDSGGFYDKFRHRIMFPIRDERGRIAGFGARVLNPEDVPKFMNSPQTPVFDKGHLLYGLDRARRDIRTLDQVVIVEGYLDVIALHQAGYANTVSPMGTALTDHQLYLIKRFTRRMVLALDPDAAGAKATMRGLEIARQTMDRTDEVVFDARGLLGHERRLQADIRVTTLPEGKDPDDVVNADPQEWERILQAAKPVVIHVMETLASGQDLEDPKIKSQIARQVIPLIEDVPDAIERETYRQRLARLLRVDERALVGGYTPRRARSERPRRAEPTGSAPSRQTPGLQPALTTITLESRTLGVLMRRPDLLHRVDRVMQEFSLPRISISDFQRSENQVLFQLVLESLEQDLAEPLSFVLNGLDLPMMEWADVLLARTEKLDPVEDRVLEGLLRDLLLLRKIYLSDSIDYYRFQLEDAQGKDEKLADELSQRVLQHTQVLQRLDKALARYTSRSAAATH